ncbi:hypothetical protein BT69DRAFT_1157959 [Atractiella rhizophila]|nr:hypothetical protein BT69DRAFT_1157959 [Atractiella rhizophila]
MFPCASFKLVYFLSSQDMACRIAAVILLPQASVNSALSFTLARIQRTQRCNSSPNKMTDNIPDGEAVPDISDAEFSCQVVWISSIINISILTEITGG